MTLTEALNQPPAKTKIDGILGTITADEADALRKALRDPAVWSHSAIAQVLTDKVSPVSEAAVRRYRRLVLKVSA